MSRFCQELLRAFREQCNAIFRDEGVALILLGAPVIYALLYGAIYGAEVVREIPVAVVDEAPTPLSRQLTRALDAAPEIRVWGRVASLPEAETLCYAREVHGVILFPRELSRDLIGGNQGRVVLYLDASYPILYRELFKGAAATLQTLGAEIAIGHLAATGELTSDPLTELSPVDYRALSPYNPTSGYGIFILPAVLLLILQQTLLIAEGMIAATRRERSPEEEPCSGACLMGRSLALLLLCGMVALLLLGGLYPRLGLPMRGSLGGVLRIVVPYLVATVALAQLLALGFRQREQALILLLPTSIPLLMISGVSLPGQVLPQGLYALGELIPSSPAMRAFIRAQTLGAPPSALSTEALQLWLLALLYTFLLLLVTRRRGDKKRAA